MYISFKILTANKVVIKLITANKYSCTFGHEDTYSL